MGGQNGEDSNAQASPDPKQNLLDIKDILALVVAFIGAVTALSDFKAKNLRTAQLFGAGLIVYVAAFVIYTVRQKRREGVPLKVAWRGLYSLSAPALIIIGIYLILPENGPDDAPRPDPIPVYEDMWVAVITDQNCLGIGESSPFVQTLTGHISAFNLQIDPDYLDDPADAKEAEIIIRGDTALCSAQRPALTINITDKLVQAGSLGWELAETDTFSLIWPETDSETPMEEAATISAAILAYFNGYPAVASDLLGQTRESWVELEDTGRAQLWFLRGNAHVRENKYEDARSDYDQASALLGPLDALRAGGDEALFALSALLYLNRAEAYFLQADIGTGAATNLLSAAEEQISLILEPELDDGQQSEAEFVYLLAWRKLSRLQWWLGLHEFSYPPEEPPAPPRPDQAENACARVEDRQGDFNYYLCQMTLSELNYDLVSLADWAEKGHAIAKNSAAVNYYRGIAACERGENPDTEEGLKAFDTALGLARDPALVASIRLRRTSCEGRHSAE